MSSVAEIRHHINAVDDTAKITRAMHLISSAKMKKAMQMHDNNLLYFQKARSVIRFWLENSGGSITSPYFRQHPGKRAAFLVIAADKGLCGGYNQEILKLARKTIEVKGAFTGNTADGYLADESMVFDPLVVAISGPKTVISKVDHAFVAITREDVDRTLSYSTTYSLVDSDDNPIEDSSIQRETEEVTVTLNVLSTKEVPLDVTIIDGGGATRDANTRIDIEPKTIMLAGDASAIDSTTKLILGTINLSSFATDFSATYTIIPPNGTENMTGVTEATVRVSITGVATKSFSVNPENIVCINVPDGYTAENITQALNVTVRAPQEVLDQISEVNLRAVADLSNLGTNASGVFTPTVEIKIDGFPEAGCVGEYKIYITLKEKH